MIPAFFQEELVVRWPIFDWTMIGGNLLLSKFPQQKLIISRIDKKAAKKNMSWTRNGSQACLNSPACSSKNPPMISLLPPFHLLPWPRLYSMEGHGCAMHTHQPHDTPHRGNRPGPGVTRDDAVLLKGKWASTSSSSAVCHKCSVLFVGCWPVE